MTDTVFAEAPFGDDKTSAPTASTVVPHSREAEEAVVGAVFINSEVYYDVAQFLSADDFYIHRHRWIWDDEQNEYELDTEMVRDALNEVG